MVYIELLTTPDANLAELGHLLEGGSEDDEDFLDSGDDGESEESDGQEEEIEEEEEEEEKYDRKGGKEKGKNTREAACNQSQLFPFIHDKIFVWIQKKGKSRLPHSRKFIYYWFSSL